MNRGNYRVAHLSSVHPPRDIRVFEKECRSLAAAGFNVTLIIPDAADADIDGVHVHAIPRPKSRVDRMLRTVYRVYAAAVNLNADLYHFHDPELIPAALALKARGKRVIYDAHENPAGDIMHAKGYVPPWARLPISGLVHGMEKLAAAACDGIVTITEGFAKRFPADKTCVVSNYPIVVGDPTLGLAHHAERDHLVIFSGGLSKERGAPEMVEGIAMIQSPAPIRFVIAGATDSPGSADELKGGAFGAVLDYVGRIPRPALEALLGQSRVALLMTPLRPDFEDISSNKLYEYMLFGLPVVVSPIPSWRAHIEKHECGIVLAENSPAAVADAVGWLLSHPDEAEAMGRRGAEAVHAFYNWSTEAAKLVNLYDNLLSGRPVTSSR